MNTKHKPTYGWMPDVPDHRDHLFAIRPDLVTGLPLKVDLRPLLPLPYDQGQLGSCTANAIAAAIEFDLKKQSLPDFIPSRLFIYYNERAMEGTIKSDAGAQIRDGVKSVAKLGVCDEKLWPYNPSKFAKRPLATAYTAARLTQVVSYQRVARDLGQMRGCLAAGYPWVAGFSVYDAFESDAVAKSGVLNMPGPKEGDLGGHAVLVVGYDDATQRFLVRNSWGTTWGMGGNFTMPYAYLLSPGLSSDFWTIRALT